MKGINNMTKIVRDQILKVRATGETNMFDLIGVKLVASSFGYIELLDYLEENQHEYLQFIMFGDHK